MRQQPLCAEESVAYVPQLPLGVFISLNIDPYSLWEVTDTKSAFDSGFVASSFFAFFNGFLLFLAILFSFT